MHLLLHVASVGRRSRGLSHNQIMTLELVQS